MFKLFVFLALVALAVALPKAAPQVFSSGVYGAYPGYSNLGYGGAYATPYAYGGYGNYFV